MDAQSYAFLRSIFPNTMRSFTSIHYQIDLCTEALQLYSHELRKQLIVIQTDGVNSSCADKHNAYIELLLALFDNIKKKISIKNPHAIFGTYYKSLLLHYKNHILIEFVFVNEDEQGDVTNYVANYKEDDYTIAVNLAQFEDGKEMYDSLTDKIKDKIEINTSDIPVNTATIGLVGTILPTSIIANPHIHTLCKLSNEVCNRQELLCWINERFDIHRLFRQTTPKYTINMICVNGTFTIKDDFGPIHNQILTTAFSNIIQKIFQQNSARVFSTYYQSLIVSYKDQFVFEFCAEDIEDRTAYSYHVKLEQAEMLNDEDESDNNSFDFDTLNMVMTGLVATLSVVGFVLWFNRKQ